MSKDNKTSSNSARQLIYNKSFHQWSFKTQFSNVYQVSYFTKPTTCNQLQSNNTENNSNVYSSTQKSETPTNILSYSILKCSNETYPE